MSNATKHTSKPPKRSIDEYADIINQKYTGYPADEHIDIAQRAGSIQPFMALDGFHGEINEMARQTKVMITLNEDKKKEINCAINTLIDNPSATARFSIFVHDERKEGGSYMEVISAVKRFDNKEGRIILSDGSRIDTNSIIDIQLQ